MAHRNDGRHLDPGTRLVLEELRDLRVEMRADRATDRRRAEEERRRAEEERRRSDERFELLIREFNRESARREAVTQKAFRDIRAVGLSIVKTLNRHTRILEHVVKVLERHGRILEQIDRKLGARGNGRPGPENGGRA